MRAANLGLKFVLELCAIALLCAWGFRTGTGWVGVVLGLAAAALMILVWGRWAAPRARGRLARGPRIALEMTIFAIAAVLAFSAGLPAWPAVFVAAVILNAIGMSVLGQWEA